jgi:hypothetical protein
MALDQENLTLKDLDTLMKSYENSIKLSTIVLEQLKQIIEMQRDLLTKHGDISTKQKSTCDALNNVVNKLTDLTEKFKELKPDLEESHDTIKEDLEKIKETLSGQNLETVKNNSRILFRIHALGGAIAGGAVGLITIIVNLLSKGSTLDEILRIVILIAKKLGVVLIGG